MNSFHAFIAFFAALALPATARAGMGKDCPIILAPAQFPMHAAAARSSAAANEGIAPNGFIGIRGVPIVHGIDVSKYQGDAKFTQVYDCGGRFAYVRLSAGWDPDKELEYRTLWSNARNAAGATKVESGLIPGGYHNLAFPPELAALRSASPADISASVDRLSAVASASATGQADLFLKRLDEVIGLDPKNQGTYHYLPMALDLSTDPLPNSSPAQQAAFGPLYAAMICGFLTEIDKSPHGGEPVVMYIAPGTYAAYHLGSAKCDLSNIFLWLRYRAADGLDYSRHMSPFSVSALCLRASRPIDDELGKKDPATNKANRCIMEQYTSYGGFAVFNSGAPLDLDRLFLTESPFRHIEQTEH